MKFLFFLTLLFLPFTVFAVEDESLKPIKTIKDYEKYFMVDLDAPLPDYETLFEEFRTTQDNYDPKYYTVWDFVDAIFDKGFKSTIVTYGGSEKRVPTHDEDMFLEMIKSTPPHMYQYIGPMLHEVPGMSEKILNYPGIKETKNKFPTRIAPQLQHIENLEFLSPFLYYVLMPEFWPDNKIAIESKPIKSTFPKVSYNPKFYDTIKTIVPPETYQKDFKPENKLSRSDLRTIEITPNTLLTAADVRAFIKTMDDVQKFGQENRKKLSETATFLNIHEANNNQALPVNTLKDLVNPCQRLVQRVKIIGKEREFLHEVAKNAFNVKEWAYTCDKVFKAYRVSYMSSAMLQSIRMYQRGLTDDMIASLSPKQQEVQLSTMQSILEMYNAPINDVMEVRKHRNEIREKLNGFDYLFSTMPISYIY